MAPRTRPSGVAEGANVAPRTSVLGSADKPERPTSSGAGPRGGADELVPGAHRPAGAGPNGQASACTSSSASTRPVTGHQGRQCALRADAPLTARCMPGIGAVSGRL